MWGEKTEERFSIARLILDACKEKSPNAKYELSKILLEGCEAANIPPNPIESRRLLVENASEPISHGASQYELGNQLLKEPIGDNEVPEEGLTWLKRAALNGLPAACAQLGYMFYNANDFKRSHEYLMLAKYDHPECLYLLGLLHSSPKLLNPVETNHAKAYDYFLQAANMGLAAAQYNVGVALMPQGNADVEPEVWKAIEYWKMAAEQGFTLALLNLGKVYLQGMEHKKFKVERDLEEARVLFERVVEDGKVEGTVDQVYVEEARGFLERIDMVKE
jgi:TPR repeat protein